MIVQDSIRKPHTACNHFDMIRFWCMLERAQVVGTTQHTDHTVQTSIRKPRNNLQSFRYDSSLVLCWREHTDHTVQNSIRKPHAACNHFDMTRCSHLQTCRIVVQESSRRVPKSEYVGVGHRTHLAMVIQYALQNPRRKPHTRATHHANISIRLIILIDVGYNTS